MQSRKKLGVILSVLLASVPSPATARLVDVTWTGVVAYGSVDQLGLFGPPNGDLVGQRFVANYRVETSRGYEMSIDGNHITESVIGGPRSIVRNPIEFSNFILNGHNYIENGDYWGTYSRSSLKQVPEAWNYSDIFTSVTGKCYLDDESSNFFVEGTGFQIEFGQALLPTKLDRSFYWNAQQGGSWYASGRLSKFDLSNVVYTGRPSGGCIGIEKAPRLTELGLNIDSVRISVPEPARLDCI